MRKGRKKLGIEIFDKCLDHVTNILHLKRTANMNEEIQEDQQERVLHNTNKNLPRNIIAIAIFSR